MAGNSVTQSTSGLNWMRGTVFPTVTNPFYIALLHTYVSGDDTGASDVESVYTNYARQSVASTTAGWAAPTPGTGTIQATSNAALLTFPTAGATGDTGLNGFAVCVHSTPGGGAVTVSGEEVKRGAITGAPKTINGGSPGDPVTVAIGSLILSDD